MPFKVTDESGKEIEVYSAEEVAARDKEVETLKTKAIDAYSKGDEDLKKKLTENYDLVKIDGVDQDSIQRKVELSYNMLGLGKPKINPFSQHYVGEAPNKGMEEKFADTDKGK